MAGTYLTQASADTRAPPEVAWHAVIDPAGYATWFAGAFDVAAAKGYPAVGGVLTWKVKWGRTVWEFAGRVVENDAPRRLVMRVATRRSRGLVTHSFEPMGSGTRYSKSVATEGSWLERVLARAYMPRSVRREVRAAMQLADGLHDADLHTVVAGRGAQPSTASRNTQDGRGPGHT